MFLIYRRFSDQLEEILLKQSSVRVRDAGDWLDKASSKIRTPGSQGSQFADGSLKLLGQF